jgi:hypothetical protein
MRVSLQRSTIALAALACYAGPVLAASIPVPNGNFESIGPNLDPANGAHWGSEPGGDGIVGDLDTNDGFSANGVGSQNGSSRYGTGWTAFDQLAGQGLEHPDNGQYSHLPTPPGPFHMNTDFSGYWYAHMNVGYSGTPAVVSPPRSAQSKVLSQVAAGTYAAQVAVGFREGDNWNDLRYTLELVAGATADPADGGVYGSTGGTVIGSSTLLVPKSVGNNFQNTRLLNLNVNVGALDPTLGQNLAIRLTATNNETQNGAPATLFAQANWDNVTLDFQAIPEPSSCVMAGFVAMVMGAVVRRRR